MHPNHTTNEIPYGYCHCGCGQKTTIAKSTDSTYGSIKGEPRRFVHNHHTRAPILARFWAKVDKRGPDECWEWQAATNPKGYGVMGDIDRKCRIASRLGWELMYGPIPPKMLVCHTCDNPPCCNPSHWFLGSTKDNADDMVAKGRHVKAPVRKGEVATGAKLTADKVTEIRIRVNDGEGYSALAREYGVTPSNIGAIVRRATWRHVP